MEIWKDVVGYKGLYEVSSMGNVKSLKNGRWGVGKERLLKPGKNTWGYLSVGLYKNKKCKYFRVNRLVGIAFIDNDDTKEQINHINGVKTDNRVENLEWTTRSENVQHAFDTGLNIGSARGKFGKDHPKSKSVYQYSKTGEFIKKWLSIADVQRELGINNSHISSVCNGRRKTTGGFVWKYM